MITVTEQVTYKLCGIPSSEGACDFPSCVQNMTMLVPGLHGTYLVGCYSVTKKKKKKPKSESGCQIMAYRISLSPLIAFQDYHIHIAIFYL